MSKCFIILKNKGNLNVLMVTRRQKTKIPLIVNHKVQIGIKWYKMSTYFHQYLFAWFDR